MIARHGELKGARLDEGEDNADAFGDAEFKKAWCQPAQAQAAVKVRLPKALSKLNKAHADLFQFGVRAAFRPTVSAWPIFMTMRQSNQQCVATGTFAGPVQANKTQARPQFFSSRVLLYLW